MVHAPTSLIESGEQIDSTLSKLQPKLHLGPFAMDGLEFLTTNYPKIPKKVHTWLAKLVKGVSRCQLCESTIKSTKEEGKALLLQRFDWADGSVEPKRLVVCCDKCYKVSNLREFLNIYLEESFLAESSSSDLSALIEHYLRVNGYKLSDLDVFNGALALAVSLRTSVAKMDLSTSFPDPRPNLESYISTLTSSQ